ncbi:hypothetical protein P691DRAFT_809315 [Macrolepiota fuliginosa MF-IS2]|uniref:NACHT domain-containing protein n=1 Tax=Macrolepiota fuliginosa MF-IS2 TaxID=1400762 RepID=A0A9P6BXL0_9AGAR|nr:hypothetical protein P691DRAFT_809315 [Macrolepiota fuliginosa MF-IS2]
MSNPVLVQNDIKGTDNFMKDFAERTIPGAAFDDLARDPPPRCHPGTRLAILQRAQDFLANPHRDKNMFWIVGPAGVGKSAIMQSLAENAPSANSRVVLGASLFFSINGRNDGSRTLITLAYQIAVHNSSYRQYIQKEVMNDPKLLEKLLPTQFSKFIVEPFARRLVHSSHTRFLILIDGLDECNSNDTQCELLGLISFFCLRYPTAPLVWIIASRPEPHITAYFSRTGVSLLYEMEDILINSNEGREDVERYLRYELAKLRPKYPALASTDQWPAERDFLKLSAGADGLFAFASTVVRFIDDPASGNPASQLQQVLEAIDNILSQPRYGNGHPMARLDALYSHILSRVPRHILPATKKLLLRLDFLPEPLFLYLCNRLSMTQDVAYGAIHHLHSVLYIPGPNAAARREARVLHKSFSDYLHDFERSGIFPNHTSQREELEFQCALRILDEILDGVNGGLDPTECISLSWESHFPAGFPLIFHRQDHYQQAMSTFSKTFFRMESRDRRSLRFTHFLKAFDTELLGRSAQVISEFLSELFREDMRAELKEHQVIYEVPIGELDSNNIDGIRMWTHDPERAIEDFEHSQSHSPDQLVAVYIDIRNRSWLCHRFADPYNEGLQSADFIPYQFPPPNGT